MRRVLAAILTLLIVLPLFGCSENYQTDITREAIIAAYENAGYSVWSRVYDEKLDYGEIAYIQANHPDGDYIYFSFFETEAQAQAYKEEFYHPIAMGLFSAIFGDPSWQRWDVYGCVVVEYNEPGFLEPFEQLLYEK